MKRAGLTLRMLVLLVAIATGLASTGDAQANPASPGILLTGPPASEAPANGSSDQIDAQTQNPPPSESEPSATSGVDTSQTSTESTHASEDAQNTTRVQTTSTSPPALEAPANGSSGQIDAEPSATSGVHTSQTSTDSTRPPVSEAPANGSNNQSDASESTAATTPMPESTPDENTNSESTAATTPTSPSTDASNQTSEPTATTNTVPESTPAKTRSPGRTKARKRPYWHTKNDGATYYDHHYCRHLVLEASYRLFTTTCQKICGRETQHLKNHTPCLKSVRISPRKNSGNFKTCAIGSCIRGRCVLSSYYTHCNFPYSNYYYYYDNHMNRDKVYNDYYQ